MEASAILQDLRPVLADILDQPNIRISGQMSGADLPGWDSLAHVTFIVAIQKRYNIKFGLDEMIEASNLGEMAHLIERKLQVR
jgi:acyl carrier protein